jgi:Flp pilus assembly pilin Flp
VAASSEEGTTFIEYVVVAAVAVVLILGVIQAFFGSVADVWTRLTQMVSGAA